MVGGDKSLVLTAWCAALALGALGQAACGGDDEGSSSSTSTGTGGTTSTSGTAGGGGSTSTSSGTGGSTSTSSSTSGAGGGDICEYEGPGECAPGEAWELDTNDACHCCVVQFCEPEGAACCNEPGCMAIVDCVRTAGCDGLGCLGPCGSVITANGGLGGAALAAAQTVGDCIEVPCADCNG
jgi:hypothetical protein